jgi:nucleoside-diphosphate-sugar epimerase
MKVLVLGGSYFVGRHIALELHARGHDVTLLNRGTRPMPLPTLIADRDDIEAVRTLLAPRRFDVVIDTSCRDGGQALTAAYALAGRYERYLLLSTPAVYDDEARRPLRERSFAEGARSWGEFGVHKARAENALAEMCGSRLTIVRPGYVYGAHNSLARETFVWSRVLRGRPVFVPADGTTRASFVYAPDLARIVLALASEPRAAGRTFNVAHPETLSFDEWVHAVAGAAGVEARIVHVPQGTLRFSARDYFPFRNQTLTLDVSDLAQSMGLAAETPHALGLAHTYEAYSRSSLEGMARESSVDLELSVLLGEK